MGASVEDIIAGLKDGRVDLAPALAALSERHTVQRVQMEVALLNAHSAEALAWEVPLPLTEYNLPEFPTDALPHDLREYVLREAEATQTPCGLTAMMALASTATCVQKRAEV